MVVDVLASSLSEVYIPVKVPIASNDVLVFGVVHIKVLFHIYVLVPQELLTRLCSPKVTSASDSL